MTLKCYNKPNRTKPRKFTAADVRRIARYAVDDGANAKLILASLIVAFGFGALLCKAAKVVAAYTTIAGLVKTVSISVTTAVLIDRAIQWLSRGYLQKLPFGRQLLVALVALSAYIAATDVIQGDDVGVVVDAVGSVTDVSDFLNELCDYVHVVER